MTEHERRRVLNLGVAKRAVEAAIARGDARLIGLATANPSVTTPAGELERLVGAGIRRRSVARAPHPRRPVWPRIHSRRPPPAG